MKLLIATRNKDKIIEIKEILKDLDVAIISAFDIPGMPDVIEDRDTIEGNAIKKAEECAAFSGLNALADDTGLFVDALGGAPGVYAARYAGENCTYKDNRVKMLREMTGKTNRKAQFRTVVAFASPKGIIATAEGKVDGEITNEEIGTGGFGYDAIFRATETGKTFGEMSQQEKEKISHRGRAFRKILPEVVEIINN
ncbi:MAG: RdgB/HAM1 family non-canonical purine NTP pyrophosphatase [Candidatus Cloacimonetes bacterium]|nr:RdgB/HAM1 family non-canonical purine NTP pyrophosphatase [Candidatus Cloacimonadota bacterium]MCF7814868.1 RdgB/HAM1 family non-canonical purine NTP pyrophosphatase [Candidatus Cloacimonadota bacterium]MCF7867950.1 RdgB/HAM1 family non-canonical purine NTP pyrophosphatase [Candidatus Cloacimonadota bacterium]MCF7883408.1 RdgB/HAM1 family non-canonical purine NTP pyrophosphatase [Candidatus Cloacimonadota bacterium]